MSHLILSQVIISHLESLNNVSYVRGPPIQNPIYCDSVVTTITLWPPSVYIFYGMKVYKKSIFLTTYPPPLVNVVCEWPLIWGGANHLGTISLGYTVSYSLHSSDLQWEIYSKRYLEIKLFKVHFQGLGIAQIRAQMLTLIFYS